MRRFRWFIIAGILISAGCVLLILARPVREPNPGRHVLSYFQDNNLVLLDIDEGMSVSYPVDVGPERGLPPVILHWFPDGQSLAFDLPYAIHDGEIRIFSLAKGHVTDRFVRGDITGVSWSPDGRLAAISIAPGIALPSQSTVIEVATGKRLDYPAQSEGFRQTWSPDGKLMAFIEADELRFMEIKTGRILSDLTQSFHQVRRRFWLWSPDSRSMAFVSADEGERDSQNLSLLDIANGSIRRLFTPLDDTTTGILWSPDSQYIAFSKQDTTVERGKIMVHILNVATGEDRIIPSQGGNDYARQWSPDSQWLFIVDSGSSDTYSQDVYGIRRGDEQPKLLIPNSYKLYSLLEFSPDGELLLFDSGYNDANSVYVLDMNTLAISHVMDHMPYPVWQP